MRKRILSLALALVMCLGLLSTVALAAGSTETIPCQFDYVRPFSEGLAAVRMGDYETGKWGFIDTTGKEVVPCQFDAVQPFSEGLAAVCKGDPYDGGKWGFIDKTGKEVIPCQYLSAGDFHDGLAKVGADLGVANQWGDTTRYGFINTTGKEVIPCQYEYVGDFSEGLAVVQQLDDEGEKYGFIDAAGKVIVPLGKYEHVEDFSEGFAVVRDGNGEYGFIDATGKEVVPCKYPIANDFHGGLARVAMNTGVKDEWGNAEYRYGFIDAAGKLVIPCEYEAAWDFSEGLAVVRQVVDNDEKYGFIDATGKEIVPLGKYGNARDFSEGLAAVGVDSGEKDEWGNPIFKYGFIDATGQEVIPCQFSEGSQFNAVPMRFSNGVAAAAKETGEPGEYQYGFIDKTGKEVIPCQYDSVTVPVLGTDMRQPGVSEGFAAVYKGDPFGDGKWGFVSLDGSAAPAPATAQPSTQKVNVDGKDVEFAMYALNGGSVNYIRVRDLAALLNGTAAQFEVGWDGSVALTSKTPYTGSTDKAPFHTDMAYTVYGSPTYVDGKAVNLDAIQIEYNGGGFTYYKLRDLAQALGFNVGWSAEKGVYVETDKPYDPNN